MSKVVMQTIVSVDGFIATDDDQVGPLFDWFGTGDTPLYDDGPLVTARSYDYYRPMLDAIGALVVGRHVFDMTVGWGGRPPPPETTAWSSRTGRARGLGLGRAVPLRRRRARCGPPREGARRGPDRLDYGG